MAFDIPRTLASPKVGNPLLLSTITVTTRANRVRTELSARDYVRA